MKVVTSYVLGLTGALGAAGLAQFLSYQTQPRRKTEFDLGPAAAFESGSRTRLDEVPALLIRGRLRLRGPELDLHTPGMHSGRGASKALSVPATAQRYDEQGAVLRGRLPSPAASSEPKSTLRAG